MVQMEKRSAAVDPITGDVGRAIKRTRESLVGRQHPDGYWKGPLEADAAVAALNHPNICTVHGIVEDDGTLYIAMELVEGKSLSELIGDSGLPVESVNKVVEGRPHIVDRMLSGEVQLVFNTTEGV